MRIAIEAQRIFRTKKHGMDFVVLEMIRCLQIIDHENEYWVFVAPGDDVCLEDTGNFHIVTLKSGFYPLWEQILLPRAARRIKADILHCTSNTAPLFPGVPLMLTLHDVIALEKLTDRNSSTYQNLGRVYSRFIIPKVIKKCRKVVTVSEYEKEHIVSETGLSPDKIIVNYNGYGTEFNSSAATDDRTYLLFFGAPTPKKNMKGTLLAYSRYLEKSEKKLPLRIADCDMSLVTSMLAEIACSGIEKHIECPGYIPHSELPATFGHAAAFLYTSLRESFGIPQLEAMACRTPAVISNTSALPEIAGEGALLVDPLDADGIADMLVRLETDEPFRRKAVEYGQERIKKFSWELTAKKALEIYESEGRS